MEDISENANQKNINQIRDEFEDLKKRFNESELKYSLIEKKQPPILSNLKTHYQRLIENIKSWTIL